MAKLLRLRRGTTTQHGSFTGAEGEVTVDTDKDTLVVHDNATAGGRPMLREDLNNMPASGVTAGTYGSSSAIPAITVDAKGRVTSATTSAIDSTSIANGTSNVSVAASGDITVTRAGSNVGTFGASGLGLGDNVKATFGASNDLEIYHNGSDSVIADIGAGQLQIRTNQLRVNNAANNENLIACDQDGNVQIYNDGALKFATTSTGVNVTGSVTCDGLTSDGNVVIETGVGGLDIKETVNTGTSADPYIRGKDSADTTLWFTGTDTSAHVYLYNYQSNGEIKLGTNGTVKARITQDGHFIPNADDTYDLGAPTLQWRNGYFDGTVNCDGLISDGEATISSTVGSVNIVDSNNTGTGANTQLVFKDAANTIQGRVGMLSNANNSLYVTASLSGNLVFQTSDASRAYFNSAGHFLPNANNTYDLGSSSERWRNVYTNDLNLSNEGSANDVDGTWGNWTIQEGEDDLFLLNRRNGKKYKFNLSEVN